MSSLLLHPLTTVRTRFQQNQFYDGLEGQKYKSIPDIFNKTYAKEGIRGFYKGVVPMTLRTLPAQGLFFLVYENSKRIVAGIVNIPYPLEEKKKAK